MKGRGKCEERKRKIVKKSRVMGRIRQMGEWGREHIRKEIISNRLDRRVRK